MYFRARYYDPNTGEFISRDPLGYVDGMSQYRAYFVPNSVDPTGTFSFCQSVRIAPEVMAGANSDGTSSCGGFVARMKWSLIPTSEANMDGLNGFIIQKITRTYNNIVDCNDKPIPWLVGETYFEGWEVRDGVVYPGETNTPTVHGDIWSDLPIGDSKGGSITMEGEVTFIRNFGPSPLGPPWIPGGIDPNTGKFGGPGKDLPSLLPPDTPEGWGE